VLSSRHDLHHSLCLPCSSHAVCSVLRIQSICILMRVRLRLVNAFDESSVSALIVSSTEASRRTSCATQCRTGPPPQLQTLIDSWCRAGACVRRPISVRCPGHVIAFTDTPIHRMVKSIAAASQTISNTVHVNMMHVTSHHNASHKPTIVPRISS